MQTREITVLQKDPDDHDEWPETLRVVDDQDSSGLGQATNLFVLSTLSGLAEVADLVKAANKAHRLRGLLVRSDVDPLWTALLLDRANVRVLRNVIVHRGFEVRRRVLEAWAAGAQDVLIADATAVGDTLLVIGCDFERLELRFAEIHALRSLGPAQWANLEVDEDGSFLYWPDGDIHLDRRALKAVADPKTRREQELEKLARNKRFGEAVRRLRLRSGLNQTDVQGISERHLRRIEDGHRPKLQTMTRLANAFGMSLPDYLREIAHELSTESQSAPPAEQVNAKRL